MLILILYHHFFGTIDVTVLMRLSTSALSISPLIETSQKKRCRQSRLTPFPGQFRSHLVLVTFDRPHPYSPEGGLSLNNFQLFLSVIPNNLFDFFFDRTEIQSFEIRKFLKILTLKSIPRTDDMAFFRYLNPLKPVHTFFPFYNSKVQFN